MVKGDAILEERKSFQRETLHFRQSRRKPKELNPQLSPRSKGKDGGATYRPIMSLSAKIACSV